MDEVTYKYLPPERISYLEDELLRFTPPIELNDPFECIPSITIEDATLVFKAVLDERIEEVNNNQALTRAERRAYLRQIAHDRKKNLYHVERTKKYFYERAKEKLNSNIGIFSLSKRWDSTLMWSHYCNSHKGFCVGFDKQNEFFKGGDSKGRNINIRDVIYSNDRIKVPVGKGKQIDFDVMYVKSKDWAYEEEERVLAKFDLALRKIDAPPFHVYLFKVSHTIITEIIIGANASDELRKTVTDFCSKKEICCFQSVVSETKFDMMRLKI